MSRNSQLTEEDLSFIKKEEEILEQVLEEISRSRSKKKLNFYEMGKRLKELRDEAARAKEADLPAIFDQMNAQRALIEHSPETKFPDPNSPYFAHMRLKEGDVQKDILLGYQTFLEASFPIIDWRHAPIAKIFFNYCEEDEYEEKLPGRVARGILIERNILTIKNSQLMRISTPRKSYRRADDGGWEVDDIGILPSLQGGAGSANRGQAIGTGQSGKVSHDISALLDREQYALLSADHDEPLLILGGAGCGKTTVALHRMATLIYREPKRYTQQTTIAIVPEEGLVRLSRKLLDGLNLKEVPVMTYDVWVTGRARQLIKGLPRKVCDATPSRVVRFKRHPAMRFAFRELVAGQNKIVMRQLRQKFENIETVLAILEDSEEERPILERLEAAKKEHLYLASQGAEKGGASLERSIYAFYKEQESFLTDVTTDRIDLFSSRKMLELIVGHSDGQLSEKVVNEVLSHSVRQFAESLQSSYAGIDSEKLEMADGRSLSDEVLDDINNTIDVEDFTILIELLYYKAGPNNSKLNRFRTFSHMVIDEAQDLAPLELSVLGRSLREDASITIAGDSAQQIDPSSSFSSWEALLADLDVPMVAPTQLTTTYRSTKPIAEFAHKVLGPMAPRDLPITIKEGVPVACSLFANEGHLSAFLAEALTNLVVNEPLASVVVITRDVHSAEMLYHTLEDVPNIRLVYDGEFEFNPGIDISEVSQVKGLEFDYVIIPDASAGRYRDSPWTVVCCT